MEEKRNQLKALSRQYSYYLKNIIRLKSNLYWLVSQSFPYLTKDLQIEEIESLNPLWINFVDDFWHVDTLKNLSYDEFLNTYKNWCEKNDVTYSVEDVSDLYESLEDQKALLPFDDYTKTMIHQIIEQINQQVIPREQFKEQLIELSKQLPEYEVIINMVGVDDLNAAILIAEIGDINRFERRTAITSFAGLDPNSLRVMKENKRSEQHKLYKGKLELKRSLHQIIENINSLAPLDDPIYQFMQKKKAEGKSEPVFKTAGANKFLRIYYGKVKAFMNKEEENI